MGISDLPREEEELVHWVLDWIDRMAKHYGGTVYDKNGKRWDWGQALCRECYGEDWNTEIGRLNVQTPSPEDIDRAKRWEEGELPEWFLNQAKEDKDGIENGGQSLS